MDIAVDSNNYAYVVGTAASPDFPVRNEIKSYLSGTHDIFVAKFVPEGNNVVYSTYFGGNSDDFGYGIAVDDNGNAYITGKTNSTGNFYNPPIDYPPFQPINAGGQDALFSKFSSDGRCTAFTYHGGSRDDWAEALAIDNNNSVYLAGVTYSPGTAFPTRSPFQTYHAGGDNDAFISKISVVDASEMLSITSPNGGEIWYTGAPHTITWNYSYIADSEEIRLILLQDGSVLGTIAENITISDTSYSWSVGTYQGGTAAPGNNYQVRIETMSGTYSDTSDNYFSIATPSLTLTSPIGGETLYAFFKHKIQWVSSGVSGNVRLDYSTDNGATWLPIHTSTANDGSYNWTVANTPSTTCLMRVSNTSGTIQSISPTTFSIVAIPNDCGATWAAVNLPGAHYDAAYGNDQFVAVSTGGQIHTSPDGNTWTTRTSGTTNELTGIAYGNSTYVAVGRYGTILYSSDGINWQTGNSGTTSYYIKGVTFGNGTFSAVGYSGRVWTGTDGLNWTMGQSIIGSTLQCVTRGHGTFVAGSIAGDILTSGAGADWTLRNSPATDFIYGVTAGATRFVAVGAGTILYSY